MSSPRFFFVSFFLLISHFLSAQVNPVQWSFTAKKIAQNKYEVRMTASLLKGWHIYSQKTPDGGPEPTKITFLPGALVKIAAGIPKETGTLIKKMDNSFGVNVFYYSGKVDFVQTVTVKGPVKTNISGDINYMVCDDSKCLPPTSVKFNILLK